jgi:hypothetical protein
MDVIGLFWIYVALMFLVSTAFGMAIVIKRTLQTLRD